MEKEEAREFLIILYDKLDAMAVKWLSKKDCERCVKQSKHYIKSQRKER